MALLIYKISINSDLATKRCKDNNLQKKGSENENKFTNTQTKFVILMWSSSTYKCWNHKNNSWCIRIIISAKMLMGGNQTKLVEITSCKETLTLVIIVFKKLFFHIQKIYMAHGTLLCFNLFCRLHNCYFIFHYPVINDAIVFFLSLCILVYFISPGTKWPASFCCFHNQETYIIIEPCTSWIVSSEKNSSSTNTKFWVTIKSLEI